MAVFQVFIPGNLGVQTQPIVGGLSSVHSVPATPVQGTLYEGVVASSAAAALVVVQNAGPAGSTNQQGWTHTWLQSNDTAA